MNEWLLVYDDLYAYEMMIGETEQRFIYEVDTEKYYIEIAGGDPHELTEQDINPAIIEKLKKALDEE